MFRKIIKAFTLIELLVVIAILAVLSTVAVTGYSSFVMKAHISNDETKVELINRHLQIYSMDNAITNENDLKKVINDMYGENVYDSLTPDSAQYGYHYWYDINTGNILLSKTDELTISKSRNMVQNRNTINSFDVQDSFRSNLISGYLLLDRGGSSLANIVTNIDNVSSPDDYMKIIKDLNKVKNNEYDKKIHDVLENKLSSTAIISNEGIFRYSDVENVTNVYYTSNTINISANLYEYDGTNIIKSYLSNTNNKYVLSSEEITLPNFITNVESYALYINGNNPKLTTSLDENELLNILSANATNATIVRISGNEVFEYKFNNGSLENITTGEIVGTPEYSNPVVDGDFIIECEEDGNGKVKLIDKLYVAYDQENFNLEAKFLNDDVSSKEVTWSSSNSSVISIDDNGFATIESLPSISDSHEVVLRATAVAGEHDEEIIVSIVRPISGTIKFNDSNLLIDNTNVNNNIEINYDGEIKEFSFADLNVTYNVTGLDSVECGIDYEITTDGELFEINGNSNEGYKLSLNNYEGTQELKIKVGDYLEKTFIINVIDNSESPFELVFENTDKYMYRVGNSNSISLSSLFRLIDGKNIDGRDVNLSIYDASKKSGDNQLANIATSGDGFSATYTKELTSLNWSSSTIKFNKTGVAILEIGVGSLSTRLALEVVDGTNVSNTTEFRNHGSNNIVLINNISLASGDNLIYDCKLYGNGFTINADSIINNDTDSNQHGIIRVKEGLIDNVQIIGPVYPAVQYSGNPYYMNTIFVEGNATVTNSYISGGRSAVKVGSGDAFFENTTIEGGVYANMEVVGGNIHLNNITTVQNKKNATVGDTSKKIMGSGLVFDLASASMTNVSIDGYLNQYNWITKNDSDVLPSEYRTLYNKLFQSDFAVLQHNVEGTTYINTGLIFIGDTPAISDNRTNKTNIPYSFIEKTEFGITGSIYSYNNTNGYVSKENMTYNGYLVTMQSLLKPDFKFTNYGNEPNEGDTSYYYYDGIIHIGIPNDESYILNALDGVFVTKYNENLKVNISCDGGIISGNNITFSEQGNYKISYEVTDNLFFDKDGNINNNSINYKFYVDVQVSSTAIPDAIIQVDSSKISVIWASISKGCENDYHLAASVLDGLTIIDGGEEITISSNVMPEGLSVAIITGMEGGMGAPKTWSTFKTYNGKLYFCSDNARNEPGDDTIGIQYKYTGKNGNTIYLNVNISVFASGTSVSYSNFADSSGNAHTYVAL